MQPGGAGGCTCAPLPPHPDPFFQGPEWGVSATPHLRVPQGYAGISGRWKYSSQVCCGGQGWGTPEMQLPVAPLSPALQLFQPSRDTRGGLGSTNAAFTPTS